MLAAHSASANMARPCMAPLKAVAPAPRMALKSAAPRIGSRSRTCVVMASTLAEAPLQPIMENGELQLYKMANVAGVYAVYDTEGTLQYIGLSRKIDASVSNHMTELPELTSAVKFMQVADTSREALIAVWKSWIEETVEASGSIPPGNAPGETKWQSRRAAPMKPEIKLTAGKGITGVTITDLVDQVVKDKRVVAFVKGTRTQPQCGFSHKMLMLLNENKADYEVVNVLDEVYNPGLRDAIKEYSQWPTIPQLYVDGEFLGGADIIEQMSQNGELADALKPKA